MIALVEGAARQKTPNEIALTILLSGLTLVFLLAIATLQPLAIYSGGAVAVPVLIALLVCLIPTTIGGLLSAIGIAGMDRVVQHNIIAMSGRAVEAGGDVNTLLLDKTGTITLGNRQAVEFVPLPGVTVEELADRAQLASLPDETPEGRSIVVLAKEKYGLRGRTLMDGGGSSAQASQHPTFIPFSAATRMSGVDTDGTQLRKGAADAIARWVQGYGSRFPPDLNPAVEQIARTRRHAAGRGGAHGDVDARARRGALEGHRQGRDEGAVRPAPRDGHPHGNDHGRQPAHRRRDRRRGRRG